MEEPTSLISCAVPGRQREGALHHFAFRKSGRRTDILEVEGLGGMLAEYQEVLIWSNEEG